MQNGRAGGQARVHSRGGGEGALPPIKMGKKMLSEEILTSFTYVLLMKLRGMTNTAYMQIGRGWMDRRFSMVGGGVGEAPQKMKKEAVRGNFNLCYTNEIRGDRHTLHTCKMEGIGRTGACPWWEGVGALPPTPRN